MRKKVLTITLTVLLYLAAVALGMSTVFRVDTVSVEISIASQETKAQAQAIQEELLSVYEKDSIFSVKRTVAEGLLKKYPYLRVTAFEKSYPDTLYIKIVEDTETYAIESDGGYYIVSADGIVVERRTSPVNRLDHADNIFVKGLQVSGARGGNLSGDDCWNSILSLCKSMDEVLGEIRKNVLQIEIVQRTPETFYRITMREGVKIYVDAPSERTTEKATEALNAYLSLSDEKRTMGCISLHDIGGMIVAQYQEQDNFSF